MAVTCCLCGVKIVGHGNNAQPLADGRCCGACNNKVIAERINRFSRAITLTCPKCKTSFNESDMQIENVEEVDEQYNVVIFNCPQCDAEYVKSLIRR